MFNPFRSLWNSAQRTFGSDEWPSQLISSKAFAEEVIPALVQKWEQKCFCSNPGFLKLISFDFKNYSQNSQPIAPAELTDSQQLWSVLVGKYQPLGDWTESDGQLHRMYNCPQCGLPLRSHSQQYSIHMWPCTTLPTDARPLTATGLYVVGYHAFAGKFHPNWIPDFRPAKSVEEFINSIVLPG